MSSSSSSSPCPFDCHTYIQNQWERIKTVIRKAVDDWNPERDTFSLWAVTEKMCVVHIHDDQYKNVNPYERLAVVDNHLCEEETTDIFSGYVLASWHPKKSQWEWEGYQGGIDTWERKCIIHKHWPLLTWEDLGWEPEEGESDN